MVQLAAPLPVLQQAEPPLSLCASRSLAGESLHLELHLTLPVQQRLAALEGWRWRRWLVEVLCNYFLHRLICSARSHLYCKLPQLGAGGSFQLTVLHLHQGQLSPALVQLYEDLFSRVSQVGEWLKLGLEQEWQLTSKLDRGVGLQLWWTTGYWA